MPLKALILAGGRGKRLGDVTSAVNKCMLPFHGRPLIKYSIENAARAGVEEIVIVVGYRAEDIINEIGISHDNVPIRYVIQWEQKGLVHAIECARETLGKTSFMTFLGDEILIAPKHREMIGTFKNGKNFVVCGVVEVDNLDDISKTYAIIQGEKDRIYRLIEKPRVPLNPIMGTGNCIFDYGIFDYIDQTPINQKRGEKELVDMIQCAIDEGHKASAFNIGSGYINVNTAKDIYTAEKKYQQIVSEKENK